MTLEMTPDQIDLTDVDLFLRGEQWDAWKTLRREAPVHWNARDWGTGFWNITKHEDVVKVGIDPHGWISGEGIILDNSGVRTKRMQAVEASGGTFMRAEGNMMIMSDPPRHTLLRQMVNRAFTHKAVRRMEPHVRTLVTKIIDDVIERGECDFVMDISRLLPLTVICEMVGVPDGDWETMFELSNRVLGFDDPEYAMSGPEEMSAEEMRITFDLFSYLAGMAQARRENPTDDVLTVLANGDVGGEKLNDGEIFLFFMLLIIAGNETTRNATSHGMLQMMKNPDQRQRLLDDPGLMPLTIEEIVRWASPVVHFTRRATKDHEIRGQVIKEGEDVCLWYPSANRDEDVFENPDTFDVGRKPNDHIAFGKGEHFCLGINLARLELRVIFEEMMARLPDMQLAGEPEMLRSNFIGGIKRMPVSFTPGKRSA